MKVFSSRLQLFVYLLAVFLCLPSQIIAQTNAQLSGNVADSSGAMIPHATVILYNKDQGNRRTIHTSGAGEYIAIALPSGHYNITVQANGFETLITDNVKLDVAQVAALDFKLKPGSTNLSVTVDGTGMALNTTNGTVSTVIDRQLIENMPLNGKDLQTLFELSPGTILNAGGSPSNGGGFSVDGQRPTSNYLTVDGAGANAYVAATGNSANVTGATIAVSATGGTNGILPVDAIEEYRMDTSTYTAENGRTPGGQIQVRTRSGTTIFHGTLFENFRNQVMDATDWFVKYNKLKQSQLRMNDFGGTLGGPLLKEKLFFFVAHDTLLLDQPNSVSQQDVPNQNTVQNAYPVFKTWLAAFPAGNGGPDPTRPGFDFFSASYPDVFRVHTTSIRIDTQLPRSIHAFFRANIAPSFGALPSVNGQTDSSSIYTYTGGVTIPISSHVVNDLTVNSTSTDTSIVNTTASIGGNDPNAIRNNLPNGINAGTDEFEFFFYAAPVNSILGPGDRNSLDQWNVVDALSWQAGKHLIKFGGDFLLRHSYVKSYANAYLVGSASEKAPPFTSLQDGTVVYLSYSHYNADPTISIKNTSLYVNDSWRIKPELTVNLGLRWEYNPAPSIGPLGVLALQGTSLDPATISASVTNNSLYENRHDNFAPRIGFAWSIPGHVMNTVLRGGFGTYFDTGQAATASQAAFLGYPYRSTSLSTSQTPYASINWSSLASTPASLPLTPVYLIDRNLLSPRTYEWSLTLEQQLGSNTKIATSYVGNDGEKLVGQREYYNAVNSNGSYPVNTALVSKNGYLYIATNQSHSNYQALQTQLTSRIGSKIDALASYTWGHAEDNGATDYSATGALAKNPITNSTYDLRHIFAAAIHYAPSGIGHSKVLHSVTGGWALDTIVRLQTASPFTVTVNSNNPTSFSANADLVPNQPLILHQRYNASGRLMPGGKLLNYGAFTAPPVDALGNPLRQGSSPTNGFRLFGLKQWDLAASRSWAVWKTLTLNFRVDAFNLLNTPNFANVLGVWQTTDGSVFGQAQNTYSGAYGGSASSLGSSGAQLATFQNGGPRELQLSLKLKF